MESLAWSCLGLMSYASLPSFICVVYGIAKWNSTGPTSGELKNEAEPEKLKHT